VAAKLCVLDRRGHQTACHPMPAALTGMVLRVSPT
jgi:hypothetical protein